MSDIIIIRDSGDGYDADTYRGYDDDIVVIPNHNIVLMVDGRYNKYHDWVNSIFAYRLSSDKIQEFLSKTTLNAVQRRLYVRLNGIDCTQDFLRG